MRHFGMRHFAGLDLPAESDVRDGVTYGPNSSLTGTLDASGGTAPDLTDGNLSQVETCGDVQLDSYYALAGIDAEYYSASSDASTWIVVVLLSRDEQLEYDGPLQVLREVIVILCRRYGTTAIERPGVGDRLAVPSLDGTRKYTLTQTPVRSHNQLEWKAEFSRTKRVKGGGKEVVPNL